MAESKVDKALQQLFAINKNMHVLLWENASPASNFAAQNLTVNLTGYNMYEIIGYFATDLKYAIARRGAVDGYTGHLFNVNDSNSILRRNITVAKSGSSYKMGFSDCVRTKVESGFPSSTVNNYLIPVAIYGIKFIGGGGTA